MCVSFGCDYISIQKHIGKWLYGKCTRVHLKMMMIDYVRSPSVDLAGAGQHMLNKKHLAEVNVTSANEPTASTNISGPFLCCQYLSSLKINWRVWRCQKCCHRRAAMAHFTLQLQQRSVFFYFLLLLLLKTTGVEHCIHFVKSCRTYVQKPSNQYSDGQCQLNALCLHCGANRLTIFFSPFYCPPQTHGTDIYVPIQIALSNHKIWSYDVER